MLTTAGKMILADLFANSATPTAFTYLAYGTGTTAEAITLTALTTETDREQATCTLESTNVPNDTIRFTAIFDTATAITIAEVGIFNASTAGTMLCRELLAAGDRRLTVVGGRETIIYDIIFDDGGFTEPS